MTYASAINTLLQSNAALNTLVSSRIYSYHLPDNLDVSKTAIVFTYKKDEGTHTLDADNVLEDYSLFVVCVAPNTEETETIAEAVRAFVDDYEDANLLDIVYETDINGVDQEKERYYKTLEYKTVFKS